MKEEILVKIIDVFKEIQCHEIQEFDEDKTYSENDEAPVVRYIDLENVIKLSKKELKPYIMELRNNQYIYLSTCIDPEGDMLGYFGTGWVLTSKGIDYINKNFTYKNENNSQGGNWGYCIGLCSPKCPNCDKNLKGTK